KSGQRAVINKGWGGLGNVTASERMMFVEDVPHDWLFTQVAAVIHHGGAGTTATGLKAGVPSMVVPFFGDQYFWGDKLPEMGVGVTAIPLKKLTTDNLASSITKLVTDEKMRAKAMD